MSYKFEDMYLKPNVAYRCVSCNELTITGKIKFGTQVEQSRHMGFSVCYECDLIMDYPKEFGIDWFWGYIEILDVSTTEQLFSRKDTNLRSVSIRAWKEFLNTCHFYNFIYPEL